jgi:hypothetical protein
VSTTGRGQSRLRRVARWGVIGVVLLALLAALGFALSTHPLDRSPILGTDLARETEAHLAAALTRLEEAPREDGAFEAGWAARDITPPVGTPTYGYGGRLAKGTVRIADEIFCRALALRAGDGPPLVFLTADLCLWPRELSGEIARRLADALPRERIYFGATHTHNGPGPIMGGAAIEALFGERDAEVCGRITTGAVEAAREALAALAPATLREVRAKHPAHVYNRSRPDEAIDRELVVLELARPSGDRCALVSYPAHATAIAQDGEVVCSGDYPGALCRELLARGWDGAMFLAAGTGQAGPALDGREAWFEGTEQAYAIGRGLADAVETLTTGPLPRPAHTGSIAVARAEVALPPWRLKLAGRMAAPALTSWLTGREPRAHVHAVRLGGSVWVGHAFEFSAAISLALKRRARARGYALQTPSFNGEHNFYVVPDGTYDDEVYESGMTAFGPGLGSYLARITEQLADAMHAHANDRAYQPFDLRE